MIRPALSLIVCPAFATAGVNLIANGSFEQPQFTAQTTDGFPYYFYGLVGENAIDNWTHPGNFVVLRNRAPFWVASDGEQYIELQSGFNPFIEQAVSTVAGERYTLSFDYAAQGGPNGADDALTILWGNEVVSTVDLDDDNTDQLEWSRYSFTVTASADLTTLRFEDAFAGAGFIGPLLDKVELIVVPAPAAVLALALAAAPLRRRR